MKNLFILAGVLFSTVAFAARTSTSTLSVHSTGSALIKVVYRNRTSSNVTVAIHNAANELVYSEKIRHSTGFIRPYNLKDLPAGTYTVDITDENGTQTQTVSYSKDVKEKEVTIAKLAHGDANYIVSGFASRAGKINVRIYNDEGDMIYQNQYKVNGSFSEVYNLEKIKGAFSIEVSDANGSLQDFHS